MTPWFIATRRFGPHLGDVWTRYVDWSGLHQLEELVSLDGLCEPLLPDIEPDFWPHIVQEDYMLSFFVDLTFLEGKIASLGQRNLLCVFRNPDDDPTPPEGRFEFLGYDLVDVMGGVSALSNCGGFPAAFENRELSRHGLLTTRARAFEVRGLLRQTYSTEAHADCHVWAIFRGRSDT